jgi:hypothetical protein
LRLASADRGAALPAGYGLGTVGWVSPITREAVQREEEERQGLGLAPGRDAGRGRRPSAKRARQAPSDRDAMSSRAIYEGQEEDDDDEGEDGDGSAAGAGDEGDEEVGWDEPRCHLRMVALGSMDLAQSAGATLHPNFHPANLYDDEAVDEEELRLLAQYAGVSPANAAGLGLAPPPGARWARPSLGALRKRFGFRFESDDRRVACLRR